MEETDPANFARHSWLRKLRDPFVYNETTQAAAIATETKAKAKSERRGGWQHFIGLKGGAPDKQKEMEASKCAIFGKYEEGESELLISIHGGDLTIVRRSKDDSDIILNRTKIEQDSWRKSSGEAVEKGEFTEAEVFKTYLLSGGPGENEIEVVEYRIEKPELRPAHSSKLINVTVYKFLNDNGTEKVKVSTFFPSSTGLVLQSERWFLKKDTINRKWNDTPIDKKKVHSVWMQHREIEYGLTNRDQESADKCKEKKDEEDLENNDKSTENYEGAVAKVTRENYLSSSHNEQRKATVEGAASSVTKEKEDSSDKKTVDKPIDEEETDVEYTEEDEVQSSDYEFIDIYCCERTCGNPTDYVCVNCNHSVCLTDSVQSLHEPTERLCGHCILHFKEFEGTFVEKDEVIGEEESIDNNNNELEESIDQSSNIHVDDISSSNNNLPIEEIINPEINFNLDFSFSDAIFQNNDQVEESFPIVEGVLASLKSPSSQVILSEGPMIGPINPYNDEIELVLSKDSTCLFCSTEAKYLGPHLRSSVNCRLQYAERLNLGQEASTLMIMKERKKISRQIYPSRQSENRREETAKRRENKDDIDLFNKFKRMTCISDIIFKCHNCMNLEKKEQMQAVELDLDFPDHFRRENTLWICKKCLSDDKIEMPQTSFIEHFDSKVVGQRRVFVPGFKCLETQDRTLQKNILFPSSSSALNNNNFGTRDPKNRPDIINKLYVGPGKFNMNEFLSPAYEHKLKQLTDSSKFSPCVTGRIVDIEKKKVKIIDSNSNTANVKGSVDYYNRLNEDLKFAIYTLGSNFIVSKVQLPKGTDSVWASILMQLNKVRVDVEEKKDGSGIINIEYKIHSSHSQNIACEENCKVVDIAEHRRKHPDCFLNGPLLPACANLIQTRFNQLVVLLSSIMKSSRYFATVQFPCQKSSTSELVMLLWPDCLSELNKKIANNEKITKIDKENLCSFVNENFTASLDVSYISKTFEISPDSSQKIVELAKTHQYHAENIIPRKYPSNVTLLKEIPKVVFSDQLKMIETWEDLKETFANELDKLPQEAFLQTSHTTLDDFLLHLEQSEGFSLSEEEEFFQLKLSSYPIFYLEIDEMLQHLLRCSDFSKLSAIYHRAVAISSKTGVEIVLRRPCLRDCLTLQYSPLILLAAESTIELETIGTNHKQVANLVTQAEKSMPHELQQFVADHTEVSVEEAIWLIDPKKKLIRRNTKPVYINTKENKKLKFKEAIISNLQNFTDIDDGIEFQLIKDVHDHYLERPGVEGAVLDQFLINYKDENEEGEGQNDDTPWIVTSRDYLGPPERLPPVIVLNSGKKLTLRKVPRIISYPTPPEDTDDFVRHMVVLYHPHKSHDEVNVGIEELRRIFSAKDSDPKLDGKGKEMTKLETVRSILHPQLNQKLWGELFIENEND